MACSRFAFAPWSPPPRTCRSRGPRRDGRRLPHVEAAPMTSEPKKRGRTRTKNGEEPPRRRTRRGTRAPADPEPKTLVPAEAEASLLAVTSGPREVPVLPVRHTVLFPFAILPLSVGRKRNLAALNEVMA